MVSLLLIAVIMCVFLALLAWFSSKYVAFCQKLLVSDRFAVANDIIVNEEVPAAWRVQPVEALIARRPAAPFWRRVRALLHQWYVFRLNRLMREISISSIIRKQDKLDLIAALTEIRAEWLEG